MTCTSDDWPALTSSVKPVAEKGVSQKLLGTVYRRGIGRQVTYAGHPLYLFDPSSAPFKPLGEDYLETVAPLAPWHGYWTLVSASNGNSDTGTALIEDGSDAWRRARARGRGRSQRQSARGHGLHIQQGTCSRVRARVDSGAHDRDTSGARAEPARRSVRCGSPTGPIR